MAQKIVLIDDIDGNEADETVVFTLDGVTTEIDLSKQNAAKLRKALQEFVDKGRQVSSAPLRTRRSSTSSPARAQGNSRLSNVRQWANDHGFTVSSRGRVPANVIAAYEDAHKGTGRIIVD